MAITTEIFDNAKELATSWQIEISSHREKTEKKFHAMMQRMLDDPKNKVFLIELLDQSFRADDTNRVADQLEYLFSKYKNTDMFNSFEKLLVWLFRHLGIYLPQVSVPMFIHYLRSDISNIVIKGEDKPLIKYLNARRAEQTRVNINIIGESVLGEEEANGRIKKYIQALESPNIDYISIKISTIFSQIIPLAHDWSVSQITTRLGKIYRAAIDNSFVNMQGMRESKFVNLDMEEYKDINLTIDAFTQTLSQKEFMGLHAGIVLQAYLPGTLTNLKILADWARQRVKDGGAPVKVRLVKGANQEMELTESSLRGWPCVTYMNKSETDANFKLCMDFLLDENVAPYLHTGIASHNLFDHAVGALLARERKVQKYYSAEMLEGMSDAAYHVLKDEGLELIMYAPIATKETFTNAIAYLVRRFDENTAEQNFLRHSFGLEVGSPSWKKLLESYEDALAKIDTIRLTPYRTQDRCMEPFIPHVNLEHYLFESESDTDFSLHSTRAWSEKIREKWKNIGETGFYVPVVIGGKELVSDERIEVIDKSQFHEKKIVGTYSRANAKDLTYAVEVAQADPDGWRTLDDLSRQKILMDVAHEFRKARGDLIGVAAAEVGKVFTETDVEVSEAIDFLNFYPVSVKKMHSFDGLSMKGKGVGLVVSPWNFPIAIPVGGIAAALASGNTVILKPSSDAILCAHVLCQCFWNAGVSKNTLQFVPTTGATAGEHLIPNKGIDFVIFTGSEVTATKMVQARPDIQLSAETGGKDATIVTALADRDQAIKNVVASAFNNSGQKCSATSLLVLEKPLYEDEEFKQTLLDAAASLNVGSVWDFENRIGTLVQKPSGNLEKALGFLDDGEAWLLKPSYADNNPYMLKPAIRWGTKLGDFCHNHELFGPVLSVMCANNLSDAIGKVNDTGYGLTSGIESLDEREQKFWKENIIAGNLYINRMTTGAIVLRQPFGGMRMSAIGSGKKAGGYNYVSQFMTLKCDSKKEVLKSSHPYIDKIKAIGVKHTQIKPALDKAIEIAEHFSYWLKSEFLIEHEYVHLRGESNTSRYIAVESVLLRCEDNDEMSEVLASIAAIKMSGASLHLSLPKNSKSEGFNYIQTWKKAFLDKKDTLAFEDEHELFNSMSKVERIRFLQPENVTESIYASLADKAVYIAATSFIGQGRIELMHYFLEQSISDSYHRYGNLGFKGLEVKE